MGIRLHQIVILANFLLAVISHDIDVNHEAPVQENEEYPRNSSTERINATSYTDSSEEDTLLSSLTFAENIYSPDNYGNTILHKAIMTNNSALVKLILQVSKKGINNQNAEGETALFMSIQMGLYNLFVLMLSNGADPYIANSDGETCLHESVKSNKSEFVQSILEQSEGIATGINLQDSGGNSALHYSVLFNNLIACEMLMDSGASSCLSNDPGNTPLHFVAVQGLPQFAEAILSRSTSAINVHNNDGFTAFFTAVSADEYDVAETLLKYQADPYLTYTPLAVTALHGVSSGGDKRFVNLILQYSKAGINLLSHNIIPVSKAVCQTLYTPSFTLVTPDKLSALDLAILKNHCEICDILLQNGADPGISGSYMTSLQRAINSGNCVDNLIMKSRHILNNASPEGIPPLHCAVLRDNPYAIQQLLEAGADPNIRNTGNFTTTSVKGFETALNYITPLHLAAWFGYLSVTKSLLSSNITQINSRDKRGNTPIIYSAVQLNKAVFEILLKHGASDAITIYEQPLIHICAVKEFTAGIDMLIQANISNVNLVNSVSYTPLLTAVVALRSKSVESLLSHGADQLIPDDTGETPIEKAINHQHFEIMKMLYNNNPLALNSSSEDYGNLMHTVLAPFDVSKEIFDFLIKHDINLTALNQIQVTPLELATYHKNPYFIKAMLEKQPGLLEYKEPLRLRTPILLAAFYGCYDVLNFLLEKGADPLITDLQGGNIITIKLYNLFPNLCSSNEEGDKQLIEILKKVQRARGIGAIHRLINQEDLLGHSALTATAFYGYERTFMYLWNVANGSSRKDKSLILLFAIKGGNMALINYLFKNISGSNYYNGSNSASFIMSSAKDGNQAVFDFLLERGISLEGVDRFGNNVLHHAAIGGNVDIVKKVMELKKLNIDCSNYEGYTPLMFAARDSHLRVIEYLLEKGADPMISNVYGENVIYISAKFGNFETIRVFEKYDIDSDVILGIILGRRINYKLQDNSSQLTSEEDQSLIYYFLTKSTIFKRDLFKMSAMGEFEGIHDSIMEGNISNTKGKFPVIMKGCMAEFEDLMKEMPRESWEMQSYNEYLTPLDVALLFFGNVGAVKLFVENLKMPIVYYRHNMWTTVDFALRSDMKSHTMEHLFIYYAIMNHYEMPINMATNRLGWTLAHKAAWFGNSMTLGLLKRLGSDFDMRDNQNRTPLHIAARNGYHEASAYILQTTKKSLNAIDMYGYTPLHLAITALQKGFYARLSTAKSDMPYNEKFQMIQERVESENTYSATVDQLLGAHANLNVQDKAFGWTPLHWLAAQGDVAMVALLINRGAKVNIISWRGQTAMEVARTWGRKKVYQYLKQHNGVF